MQERERNVVEISSWCMLYVHFAFIYALLVTFNDQPLQRAVSLMWLVKTAFLKVGYLDSVIA